MQIAVVLDVICPWCFIGKRRLETALARRPEITPEITWHPFQLNPDMPAEGMARQDYLAAKFGGAQHAGRVYQTVTEAGETVGIPFAFDRIRRTPNTRDAHRLIRHAAAQGKADAVVEALFQGYFIAGQDIGSRAILVELAGQAGLDPAESQDFLVSAAATEDVLNEDRSARRIGINAVPCFIFSGQYAISGAQEPEFFFPVFDLVQNGDAAAAQ